jgi:hypothetical protein
MTKLKSITSFNNRNKNNGYYKTSSTSSLLSNKSKEISIDPSILSFENNNIETCSSNSIKLTCDYALLELDLYDHSGNTIFNEKNTHSSKLNLLNGEIRNYQLFMKNTSSTLSIYDFRIWIADWFDNQDDNSAPITTLVKDFNRPYINNDQNYHSNSKSFMKSK